MPRDKSRAAAAADDDDDINNDYDDDINNDYDLSSKLEASKQTAKKAGVQFVEYLIRRIRGGTANNNLTCPIERINFES